MGLPVSSLYDTNILIDYLKGVPQARDLLQADTDPAISLVTWMEVMVGAEDEAEEVTLRRWLNGFRQLAIDRPVAHRAAVLRRHRRIRLPDAIIMASAEVGNRILITRNTWDFPEGTVGVQVPYQL